MKTKLTVLVVLALLAAVFAASATHADGPIGEGSIGHIGFFVCADQARFRLAARGQNVLCDDFGSRIRHSSQRHAMPVEKAFFCLVDGILWDILELGFANETGQLLCEIHI